MKSAIRAIIQKDLRTIFASPITYMPMVIVPVIIGVLMPVGMVILGKVAGTEGINGMDQIGKLLDLYPVPSALRDPVDRMIYIFLNYTFLSMFLIIPVMVTAIIGTHGIVGERERKTLETLLYSPISTRDFLLAKALSALVPGVVLTWGTWLLMFLGVNGISVFIFGSPPLVTSPIWIPVLIILVPALTLVELAVTLLVCIRAKTFMEAQQLSSMVVLPLVLLMYSQIAGVVVLSPVLMAILGLALAGAAWGLVWYLAPRYSREELIARI